jgi:predicted aconitase with swiveling domain
LSTHLLKEHGMMIYKGRVIQDWTGALKGEILITKSKISFLGDVDPKNGRVVGPDLDIKGKCISNKILIFEEGRGSTVGSNILFSLSRRGVAPRLMVTCRAEPVTISGAIFGNIPMITDLDDDVFKTLKNGERVKVYIQRNEAYLEKED